MPHTPSPSSRAYAVAAVRNKSADAAFKSCREHDVKEVSDRMKIAQIAPLMESVPPRLYGGTERIVSWLTEELVAQGHEVTLFASGDSMTAANLMPCTLEAIRLSETMKDYMPYYTMMVDRVRRLTQAFDIVHFHIDMFHFPLFRGLEKRTSTLR